MTSILKVTRMLKEFHLCEFRGGPASHESWISLKKVHEWIEHMAIKVQSKDFFFFFFFFCTLTWLVEVCLCCYQFRCKE